MKLQEGINEFMAMDGQSAFGKTGIELLLDSANIRGITRHTIFNIVISPPKICLKNENDFGHGTIFIRGFPRSLALEPQKPRPPSEMLLAIPVNGSALKDMLKKAGCAKLKDLLLRLIRIAEEEGLGIMVGDKGATAVPVQSDPDKVVVRIFKENPAKPHPPMKKDNANFLCMFDFKVL